MATAITQENFEKEVKQETRPIVLDVYASWCGPCQQMAPIFEELEKEMPEIKFLKLNVDEAREISIEYGVTSVPTFLFIKEGQEKGRETGYMSKEDLKAKVSQHLG